MFTDTFAADFQTHPKPARFAQMRRQIAASAVTALLCGLGSSACDSAANSPADGAVPPPAAIAAAAVQEPAPGTAQAQEAPEAPTGKESAGEPPVEAEPAAEPAEEAPAEDEPEEGEGESIDADADAGDPPEDEAAKAIEPIKVLFIGDSMVATGVGALIEKGLDANEQVTCYRKGKSSSGLARPDFYNWMDEAKRQLEYRNPQVVVVMIGGNDGQDLRSKSGKGTGKPWPGEKWNVGYRERTDALLELLAADGRQVVWLGLPKAGMRSFEKKLVTIRQIQKDAVAALGDRGVYVETSPFLVDDAGELMKHGKVRGKNRELRAKDGIHFTMSGSEFLADQVVPALLNELDLPTVEG